jgi:16S rRNA (uracil1498-N3)-methyltransferase
MRLHRFYVSQPLGEEVVIEDVPTIKQWLKVFRYTQEDSVILFNGDGTEYVYKLQETSLLRCVLCLIEKNAGVTSPRRSHVYISVIKKDLFELAVEKATEYGITDITPIITDRTEKKHLNYERLKTIIKEASEQSGRNTIPLLHETKTLDEALDSTTALVPHGRVFVATLFGTPLTTLLALKKQGAASEDLAFFVGPEGGWTPREEKHFEDLSLVGVSLAQTTLRAETAAIAVAVVISIL